MSRAVGKYRELYCHSCSRQWGAVVFSYSEDYAKPKDFPTCTCPTPHVEILPNFASQLDGGKYAQCRATQRAVYYQLPDGTIAAPLTNSYSDPGALAAVAKGGVRCEISSVREMRRLHREQQLPDSDPSNWGTDRNLVLDYDQSTIRSGSADHPLRRRTTRETGPQHNPFERQESVGSVMRIIPGGETYERARDEYQRRTRG